MDNDDNCTIKFGVVVVDTMSNPTSGWACLSGGVEPAQRISNLDELPDDAIWWSNIPLDIKGAHLIFENFPHLRNDRYLPVIPRMNLQGWGIENTAVRIPLDPASNCSFLAARFQAVMRMAFNLVREVHPDITAGQMFTGETLAHDLNPILTKPDNNNQFDQEITEPKTLHDYGISTCERNVGPFQTYRIHRPKLTYIRELLNSVVPDFSTQFQYMSYQELDERFEDFAQNRRKSDSTAMVDITVNEIDEYHASMFGIDQYFPYNVKVDHNRWVNGPEFLHLMELTQMLVKCCWFCSKTTRFLDNQCEPLKSFLNNDQNKCSWSAGIVAESISNAVINRKIATSTKPKGCELDYVNTGWQGEWIRGNNWILMLENATKFVKLGYAVVSYGFGWMYVKVPKDLEVEFILDCMELGFVPEHPVIHNGTLKASLPTQWGGDELDYFTAVGLLTGNREVLERLERLSRSPAKERGDLMAEMRKMVSPPLVQ